MCRDSGRPEIVMCNGFKVPYQQLPHELIVTDFALCYPEADVLRGYATNRRLRPDAEMTLYDRLFYVELDTGEESHAQVGKRQAVYAGTMNYVLWVTLSVRRRESLRRNCHEAVRSTALFAVLDDVKRNPLGDVWIDAWGVVCGISVKEE